MRTTRTQEQLQELASYVQEVSEVGVDAFNPAKAPKKPMVGRWHFLFGARPSFRGYVSLREGS